MKLWLLNHKRADFFGFQILDLKDHFSASLREMLPVYIYCFENQAVTEAFPPLIDDTTAKTPENKNTTDSC